jgi:DDE superfamily endonuclease
MGAMPEMRTVRTGRRLVARITTSKTPAKHYLVARVLLMSDQSQGGPSQTDGHIAETLGINRRTVIRIKKRFVQVTQQRTKKDWALFMREMLEGHYPEAAKVVVVMDNLNTHTPASFYEVFPPDQAKALVDRLEIHYTPKHASWLNIAEIELSVLARQGLAHNIATIEELCRQVKLWQEQRNQQIGTANWQFRTADARIKLKRLYPVQQPDSRLASALDGL